MPSFQDLPLQWYTDSKSLHDVVTRDTSLVTDKRLRIVVAQLRELYLESVCFAWIDTQVMIADSLTKMEVTDLFLKDALNTGHWSTASTSEALARKAQLQAQRRERKQNLRLSKSGANRTEVFWVCWSLVIPPITQVAVQPSETTKA
eukprot:5857135-Amphidinium_carterae.3